MDHADNCRSIVANGNSQHTRTAKQQPRTILEEEEYTSTLKHIVTRDYFPSLPSLRRDAAILEARSRGDISGAVAVRRMARKEEIERERELKEEMEEEQQATVVTETGLVSHNGNNDNAKIQVRKRPRPLKHESITGFHARVTSEDNAEFEMNQEREMKEREETLGVVYAARADREGRLMIESYVNSNHSGEQGNDADNSTSNNNARALLGCDSPLELSSDLFDAPPSAGLRITDNNKHRAASYNGIGRNGLFFQPQHRSLDNNQTDISSGKLMLTSSGAPSSGGTFLVLENNVTSDAATNNREEGNNATFDNLLMPPPPIRLTASSSSVVPFQQSNDQSNTTNFNDVKSTQSIDHRCQLVEYLPKPLLPDIHPPATRFPYQNNSRLLANNNNDVVRANRGMHRSCTGSYTDASDTTDLDASPPPLDLERAAHEKARRREHETFVAMTPLIQPGGGGNDISRSEGVGQTAFESDEPIMTWGDIASTPLVLGSGSAVDGRSASSADWEPTRPASLSTGNDGFGESSAPAFDVVDESNRETVARRAEKGLLDRANSYRAAGNSGLSKSRKKMDDESVSSSRSKSMSATPLDRASSLTPAARALLEASNYARRSKKKYNLRGSQSSSSSCIFQTTNSGSSGAAARIHAGSRDSFGSALRMSYTPNATPHSRESDRKRKSSSSLSSLRQATGGATPRCHSRR